MEKKVVRVGVIGCGSIGNQHIDRLMNKISQTTVTLVCDYFVEAAKKTADRFGVKYVENVDELINSNEVDAVLITSADESHAEYVLKCIAAGKYVFCEKPLSQTAKEAETMIEEELKHNKRLVQVGFMRRYDKGYMEMKKAIEDGEIGEPLIIHAAHRNLSQAAGFETDYAITRVAIHEIDICRWLLADEYESVQVLKVKQSSRTVGDWLNPQMMILTTKSGQHINLEVQTDHSYGYDIQCQVVGEDGTLNLPDPAAVVKRIGGKCAFGIMDDWSKRFIDAYDVELEKWAIDILDGKLTGPSTWDGYISCVASDALIKSRKTGVPEKVETIEKPDLYK